MALPILDGNQSATTLSTILSSGQHITAHTVVSLGTQAITDMRGAVSGSVVSISNFPSTQTIAGTVTANLGASELGNGSVVFGVSGVDVNAVRAVIYSSTTGNFAGEQGRPVDSTNPLPISGTVTANNSVLSNVLEYDGNNFFLRIGGRTASGRTDYPIAISGSVTASISNSVTIASLPAISGTVTANSSNGSLTTRFGSVVTANTAFETSAVTNANRKYLLIQNVTTASNVITVGIGFTPTTTQGIQLFAGAGLTFEGSYIPTGAVNLLSSVTASCFTILEA